MPSLVVPDPPVGIPGVPTDVLCALVAGSQWIFDCTREASELARDRRCTVAFVFIDRTVAVRPDDDAEKVARAWWIGQYGETFEQTRSRR